MPEHTDDVLKPGQHFDPGPFALDLYRLLCVVLADKAVAKLSVDARGGGVAELQTRYRKVETTRVLVSSYGLIRMSTPGPKISRRRQSSPRP